MAMEPLESTLADDCDPILVSSERLPAIVQLEAAEAQAEMARCRATDPGLKVRLRTETCHWYVEELEVVASPMEVHARLLHPAKALVVDQAAPVVGSAYLSPPMAPDLHPFRMAPTSLLVRAPAKTVAAFGKTLPPRCVICHRGPDT